MSAAAKLSYQERKERGICTEGGCKRRASDDSAMCKRHHRAARRRNREAKQRLRESRRSAGLCLWCSGRSPAAATPGSTSCLPCRIRRQRIRASDGGVSEAVHDRTAQIAAATRTHADGRTRYHGQGKRGQQPRAQLDRQDLDMAEKCFRSGREGLALLETPEVQAQPRIQRSNVKSAALHELDRATRHIDDVLERNGHFGKRHGPRSGDE